MIESLLTPFVFLLGAVLCFQALGACYAIIDLWYAIETHQIRIIVGVLTWCAAYLLTWWWLPGPLADAYAHGGWTVIVFHVGIALTGQLMPYVAIGLDKLDYWSLSRREARSARHHQTGSFRGR